MLLEAKSSIVGILEDVEKNVSGDLVALKKIRELKEKVNTSMKQNDDLKKWYLYQSTADYHQILDDFSDSFWDAYPKMSLASAYFQKPCFFNED